MQILTDIITDSVWFYILFIIKSISSLLDSEFFNFRHLIALFLAFADAGIFLILFGYKKYIPALFFIFSPISIIITGYHSQFDNLAVFIMLLSALVLQENEKDINEISWTQILFFCLIVGISITVKHIFIFFPFWLFFKAKNMNRKLFLLTVPVGIFVLSFFPYCWSKESINGILNNVFMYNSFDNSPFYNIFLPLIIQKFISKKIFFFLAMIIAGYFYREKNIFESIIHYSVLMVIFSSAIANQYLAIPIIFTAFYINLFNILYNISGCIFLLGESSGLNMVALKNTPIISYLFYYGYGYYILIILLFFGYIISFDIAKSYIRSLLKNIMITIKNEVLSGIIKKYESQ